MVNNTTLPPTQSEITLKQVNQIHFICFNYNRITRANLVHKIEAQEVPKLDKMKKHTASDDIEHMDVKSDDEARPHGTVNDVHFYVRMVFDKTHQPGGFLHNFCQLSDDYLFRQGVWIKQDKNYKRFKSLQITYTNDIRERNRPALDVRKNRRTQEFKRVKEERVLKNLEPIIQAVFPPGETLVPDVEIPSLALDVGPQTDEPLLPHDADVCPTAQSFGLSAQVDAAGPRKKKTKVLRFLSASDAGGASDVSTADSGH
jgi:hypothetical protein